MIERLTTDQTEITRLTTIDWQRPMWRETTLLTDRAVQFATAKTYVFSDSVLCLGGVRDEPVKANFAKSGHPVIRASSALARGELKSKGKGMKTGSTTEVVA